VHPQDRERTLLAARQIMDGEPKQHFHNRYLRKDGRVVHIMWSARWSETYGVRIAVARDITELKRAESMQVALHAISEAAHQAKDLLALFQYIHLIIGKLLPAINFFVALYDEERDELSFPYFVDQYDERPETRQLDSGTLSAEVIRSRQALLLTPDIQTELPDTVRSNIGRDALDWLGVPLASSKGVIGALVVQSYSGDVRYTESDKVLLQFVSTQVAAAIERKQTETRLQYIALHDQLTTLPNRELLNDRLHIALALARREHQQLALLYIDLDRFKQVNDSLGHEVGDQLLREAARRLAGSVRESDTVGRIGGDEFVVLLHGIDRPQHAIAVAEKIILGMEAAFELSGAQLDISCSIGIALYPAHGDSAQQLMRRADDAMYAAKRQGGHRIEMATQPA
jgi:diguanylate cyclase (GGDEF)-like protein